jgi:glucose dehydrogenase
MTCIHEGRQYVAIKVTGRARLQTTAGDNLVVLALSNGG